MVVVTERSVEIYDFWPDREYEGTEDMDSEESGDEDLMIVTMALKMEISKNHQLVTNVM